MKNTAKPTDHTLQVVAAMTKDEHRNKKINKK